MCSTSRFAPPFLRIPTPSSSSNRNRNPNPSTVMWRTLARFAAASACRRPTSAFLIEPRASAAPQSPLILPRFALPRAFAGVAEAEHVSGTDEDVVSASDHPPKAPDQINGAGKNDSNPRYRRDNKLRYEGGVMIPWRDQAMAAGISPSRYLALKRRQVKIETEAWEKAANDYRNMLADMCEKKLVPTLPYMKSLFLGWFEPLRDAITAEQERCRNARNRMGAHEPYMDRLAADMMAVITMHKMMGLLMMSGDDGCVRVVAAAC